MYFRTPEVVLQADPHEELRAWRAYYVRRGCAAIPRELQVPAQAILEDVEAEDEDDDNMEEQVPGDAEQDFVADYPDAP